MVRFTGKRTEVWDGYKECGTCALFVPYSGDIACVCGMCIIDEKSVRMDNVCALWRDKRYPELRKVRDPGTIDAG